MPKVLESLQYADALGSCPHGGVEKSLNGRSGNSCTIEPFGSDRAFTRQPSVGDKEPTRRPFAGDKSSAGLIGRLSGRREAGLGLAPWGGVGRTAPRAPRTPPSGAWTMPVSASSARKR